MKVLIKTEFGTLIFDSKNIPILIEMSSKEKENISNMHPEATRYLTSPASGKLSLSIEEAKELLILKI